MCLYSSRRFPKIAREDIECYKVIHVSYNPQLGTFKAVTPVQGCELPIDELLNNQGYIQKGNIFPILGRKTRPFEIGSGYIHVYSKDISKKDIGKNNTLFRCIIPKGTLYFTEDYTGQDILAAKKIKYLENITRESINAIKESAIRSDHEESLRTEKIAQKRKLNRRKRKK